MEPDGLGRIIGKGCMEPLRAKEIIAKGERRFFAIAMMAVLAETVLLAIRDYGSTRPSFLDSWQEALGTSRSMPPIVALGILVIASFWVWRYVDASRTKNEN
jgi:hypothetical protein